MKKIELKTSYELYRDKSELLAEDLDLINRAFEETKKSYAPYSKFNVGCVLLLENGKIVTGSNQENAAYPSGMCAERVAIWKASSEYPAVAVLKLAIAVHSKNNVVDEPIGPCGGCRQTLSEYEVNQKKPIELLFTGEKGPVIKTKSLLDLLPLSFNRDYL